MQQYILANKELIEPCNDSCSFCFLNYADLISENYLFNGFKPKVVGDIIKKTNHKVKTFEKDEIIVHHGERINCLYIIVKGIVVGESMGYEGKILRIEELKAPDAIASSFIYGKDNSIPFDYIAKEFTKTLIIQKADLMGLFMSNEKLLTNYFNIISCRAQTQSHKLKMLGLNTLKGKIAQHLIDISKQNDSLSFIMNKTQNDLSEMFGVARPYISRVFKELDEKKIIRAKGKNVTIENMNALVDLLK